MPLNPYGSANATNWPLRAAGPRVADRRSCLTAWGAPTYRLYLWIWVHPAARPRLAEAGRPVPDTLDYAEPGPYARALRAPYEGERYTEIGARVADALWGMVEPTAALLLPPTRRRRT